MSIDGFVRISDALARWLAFFREAEDISGDRAINPDLSSGQKVLWAAIAAVLWTARKRRKRR